MNELTPPFSSELGFRDVKLNPYRILDNVLPNKIIYEFWRGDPKGDGKKEMSMIIFDKNMKKFTLQYYPLDSKDIQVVKDLPIERLREAAENLKSAGFI